MTVINTNVGALQARTYAVRADGNVTKAMERLSSGLRINSAADDAAGLAVANKMESQIRGMNMAIRNSQDGISLVQTAESAMGEINNMVIRMRELAVQMNNGVYTDTDRANAQLEVTALLAEIDKVATNSAFNQVKILDGTYSQDIRAGNTNPEVINVTIDRMNTDSLGGGRVTTGETSATLSSIAHVVAGVDTTLAAGTNTAKHFETTITATEGRPTIALSELGLASFATANAGGSYSISAPTGGAADEGKFAVVGSDITLNSNVANNTELDFENGSSAAGNDTYSFKVSYTTTGGVTVTDDVSLKITDKAVRTANATTGITGTVMEAQESVCLTVDAATLLSDESKEFIAAANTITYELEVASGNNSVDLANGGFGINDTTGKITASADFERPTDYQENNSYSMTVKMTDESGTIMREEIQVNVTDFASDIAVWAGADAPGAVAQIASSGEISASFNTAGVDDTVDLATNAAWVAFEAQYDDAVPISGFEVISIDGTAAANATTIQTGITMSSAGVITFDEDNAAIVAGKIENVLIRFTADGGETFEFLTDIQMNDANGLAAGAPGAYTQTAAAPNGVTGNHSTVSAQAGGEAATLDLTDAADSKFIELAAFYAANQCGLFEVENLEFNGGTPPAGEPTVKVNNSGELILEEGIAAGTYSLDVRYQTNDGSTFLQRMDITVTEVGTRGENVTAGNAVATTATVKSHASTVGTKVAAESEQVSGITVANMAEGRQGTLQATGSNSVLSAAFNTFVSKPDYAGGTFTLGNLNGSSDAALFKIDATTGAIETKGLVDYESKTEYNITVTYTTADANSPKTYTEDVTIRVADDKVDNTTHITNVDLGTQSSSASAVTILDQAINQISSSQAKLGAIQNRLQYNIDNLSKASMLTQTAKGRIMDADFASETSELSKQQILSQAATSMLAQANQSKQSVLALLQ